MSVIVTLLIDISGVTMILRTCLPEEVDVRYESVIPVNIICLFGPSSGEEQTDERQKVQYLTERQKFQHDQRTRAFRQTCFPSWVQYPHLKVADCLRKNNDTVPQKMVSYLYVLALVCFAVCVLADKDPSKAPPPPPLEEGKPETSTLDSEVWTLGRHPPVNVHF